MAERAHVPAGAYRRAACRLTAEHGEFTSYNLASAVRSDLGRSINEGPSYRSAARWIRREANGWIKTATGFRSGVLRRTGAAVPGPGKAGGCPAFYAVVATAMLKAGPHG